MSKRFPKNRSPDFYIETEQSRGMDVDFGVQQTQLCLSVPAGTSRVALDHLLKLSELFIPLPQRKRERGHLRELSEDRK